MTNNAAHGDSGSIPDDDNDKQSQDGSSDLLWGADTDAEIARSLGDLRARYCPECERQYGWDKERCENDGSELRDSSILAMTCGFWAATFVVSAMSSRRL